ncbi:Histidinol-phosphate aminotransferase [Richelia intracellularis HH01]|uniref:Histidinol-phosphate aminotransferase n=1 Tax=Richelia intracellularis HH01 TaxID=1165094 RepID=M1WZV8_9NOST|nr:histidinol-phosphate transaminase [Richelia intracellularis]CCH67942.1 Histidinol-phosphate aminotransferase [Richelia intracellularis HH01]
MVLPFIRSDLVKFIAYNPFQSGRIAQTTNLIQIDKLDTNESSEDFPPQLQEKLLCTYQESIKNNRYPDSSHEKLKSFIANYVNESAELDRQTFSSQSISISNGSDELIRSILIASCVNGEGSILVAEPTFSMYEILAKTLGIPIVTIPRNEDNFAIDLQAATSAIYNIKNPPIRTVFIVHPNSPTGNTLNNSEVDWLINLPENILVVIDEAYFEFSQTTLVSKLVQYPNWVVLRTFSKAFRLAAHRIGYCVANPKTISILEKVRLPYNIPSFSLAAALIAMENHKLLLGSVLQTLTERDKLIQELRLNIALKVWDSRANFIFIKTQALNLDVKTINLKLRESGTLVREIYQGLRITVGTPAENKRTLQRIKAILS